MRESGHLLIEANSVAAHEKYVVPCLYPGGAPLDDCRNEAWAESVESSVVHEFSVHSKVRLGELMMEYSNAVNLKTWPNLQTGLFLTDFKTPRFNGLFRQDF